MFISSLDLLTIHGLCTTKNWYLSLIVRRVKLFFYFVEDNVDRSSWGVKNFDKTALVAHFSCGGPYPNASLAAWTLFKLLNWVVVPMVMSWEYIHLLEQMKLSRFRVLNPNVLVPVQKLEDVLFYSFWNITASRKRCVLSKWRHLSICMQRGDFFLCWSSVKDWSWYCRIVTALNLSFRAIRTSRPRRREYVMAGRNVPFMRLTATLYTPSGIHCRRWIGASHF